MSTTGFVLAGGSSTRMGRNKALLPVGDRTLIEIVASAVFQAAGNVTIIGSPEVYGHLGYPVVPDRIAGAGPLAGIETALSVSNSPWNIIVACDMPGVTPALLSRIIDEARLHPEAACILPKSVAGNMEPLCAAYNKSALPAISRALSCDNLKVTDALRQENVHYLYMTEADGFQNINTPEDWRRVQSSR